MTNTLTATEQANRAAALAINAAANGIAADDTKAQVAAIAAAGKPAATTAKPADTPKQGNGSATAPDKQNAPAATTAADKLAAAINKANPAKVLPDLTAAKSTATVTSISAAKPKATAKGKAKGKADTANNGGNDNPSIVGGYDLSRWPTWLDSVKPTLPAILAVRAAGRFKQHTSNELACGVGYQMGSKPELYAAFNVFDVGYGISKVMNSMADNKQNAPNGLVDLGWAIRETQFRVPCKNPERTGNTGGRVAYALRTFTLDEKGNAKNLIAAEKRKAIYAYLAQHNCKVPAWLMPPNDVAQHGNQLDK